MLKSIKAKPKVQFKVADCKEDYEMIYRIRKAVFGQEQGYSEECLKLNRQENQYYILCLQDNIPVGTVTVEVSEKAGSLDLDKYYDLNKYYHKYGRLGFWSRNAVLKEYRGSSITPLLHAFMHNLIIKLGVSYVIVDCKIDNYISRHLIPSIGFKPIGECMKGEIGSVIVWGTTTEEYTQAIYSYMERKELHGSMAEVFRECNQYVI